MSGRGVINQIEGDEFVA